MFLIAGSFESFPAEPVYAENGSLVAAGEGLAEVAAGEGAGLPPAHEGALRSHQDLSSLGFDSGLEAAGEPGLFPAAGGVTGLASDLTGVVELDGDAGELELGVFEEDVGPGNGVVISSGVAGPLEALPFEAEDSAGPGNAALSPA